MVAILGDINEIRVLPRTLVWTVDDDFEQQKYALKGIYWDYLGKSADGETTFRAKQHNVTIDHESDDSYHFIVATTDAGLFHSKTAVIHGAVKKSVYKKGLTTATLRIHTGLMPTLFVIFLWFMCLIIATDIVDYDLYGRFINADGLAVFIVAVVGSFAFTLMVIRDRLRLKDAVTRAFADHILNDING